MSYGVVRVKNSKPEAKFPGESSFVSLTSQFDHKSVKEIISLLKKLPANKGIKWN